jgi:succinate dehydrogenase/fumarate reductase flavoprotein subunit
LVSTNSTCTATTRGTTGDGHKMAFKLGAAAVDLANVQIHPTVGALYKFANPIQLTHSLTHSLKATWLWF